MKRSVHELRGRISHERFWIAAPGASAVALGAMGAHLLQGRLAPAMLAVWQTAVQFQFWHALALALALLTLPDGPARRIACAGFGFGMALFCGSLYALALGAPRGIGVLTPFGGLALMAGWIALGIAAVRPRS